MYLQSGLSLRGWPAKRRHPYNHWKRQEKARLFMLKFNPADRCASDLIVGPALPSIGRALGNVEDFVGRRALGGRTTNTASALVDDLLGQRPSWRTRP